MYKPKPNPEGGGRNGQSEGKQEEQGFKRPVIENYFPTGLQHQFELWILHFNEQEIIRYTVY